MEVLSTSLTRLYDNGGGHGNGKSEHGGEHVQHANCSRVGIANLRSRRDQEWDERGK